ncbi:MAG: ABC transporter substrate-binding protein [Candidatus Hydrogenedentota bacterium]
MKALYGELDFQARRIDFTNYSLFKENSEHAGYRVAKDLDTSTITLYINNYSKDPGIRPILQNRDFRIALSLAINRDEINFLLFDGLGEPARGIACPHDPYYLPEFDENYLEYDPERANALLDKAGLKRGPNGMRRLPNGKPFRQMLNLYPSETGTPQELWQLVATYYREVGLDFVVKVDARGLSTLQAHNGNYNFFGYRNGVMHWVVHPLWHVPWSGGSFYAPLYGRYVASNGKGVNSVKPSPEFQRLVDWYLELRSSVDKEHRLEIGQNILRQWAEECYAVGICRPQVLTIINKRFRNVPDHIIHDYRLSTPGYIGIEQFYFEGGSNH